MAASVIAGIGLRKFRAEADRSPAASSCAPGAQRSAAEAHDLLRREVKESGVRWILASIAVLAALITAFVAPAPADVEIARVFFLLFLVGLIVAGLRAAARGRTRA